MFGKIFPHIVICRALITKADPYQDICDGCESRIFQVGRSLATCVVDIFDIDTLAQACHWSGTPARWADVAVRNTGVLAVTRMLIRGKGFSVYQCLKLWEHFVDSTRGASPIVCESGSPHVCYPGIPCSWSREWESQIHRMCLPMGSE